MPIAEDTPDNAGTPWEIEAGYLHTMRGDSPAHCRDLVILRWLDRGDTRPLAWWLARSLVPGLGILRHVASMLQPTDGTEEEVPYILVAKPRRPRRGRPKDTSEKVARDWLLAQNVENRMAEDGRGSYEASISHVASIIGQSEETVRKAYDRTRPNKKANSKGK